MIGKVIVQCGIQIDNEYWFAAGNTNGLFKKNLLTGELYFIDFFPDEAKTQFRAYTDVKRVGNKLIFTPCYAKRIAIYNIDDKKFSSVLLPEFKTGVNQYIKSVKYKDYIYFIPFSASFFIKYNVVEGNIKKLEEWTDLKKQYLDQGNNNLIIETVCTDNKDIYMFMNDKNYVIILNMDTDQFQVKSLDTSFDEKIYSVFRRDNNIWIVTNRNIIYKWNYVDNEILHIVDFNQYIKFRDYMIYNIYVTSKYVYLINMFDKDIMVFDYINREFTIIDMNKYVSDKQDDYLSLYYYYDIQVTGNNKIELFSFYDGKYITIDGKAVINSNDGFLLSKEYFEKCFSNKFFSDESCLTYIAPSLFERIEIILTQSMSVCDTEKYKEKNIGRIVYDALTGTEM